MRVSAWVLALLALGALIGFAVPAAGSNSPATEKCPNARSVNQPVNDGDTAILLDLENVVRSKGTSCKVAVSVMNAWTKCRMKTDPYGYCTKKVEGYSCHESRTGYEDQQNGRVLCGKGKSYVGHSWYQRYGVPLA